MYSATKASCSLLLALNSVNGNSWSQWTQRAYRQLVVDLGQPTQAMALDWNKLNSLPQRGHWMRFVVFSN